MKLFNKTLISTLVALTLTNSSFADCSYELFSISSTKDTTIADFVDQLSDECEFSIIVTDPYAQQILDSHLNKTHIKNLTLDEVLDIILKENNLSYTLQNNLLKISYLTTKVFNVDYLLSQRKGIGSTDVTLSSQSSTAQQKESKSQDSQSGIKIENSDEVKFWEGLDNELLSILNRPQDTYKAQKPIINKNAGLITITATQKQMQRIENYLQELQKKVQLQVLIDVQLLSVNMADSKTTGIDWKQLYALQNVELAVDTTYGDTQTNLVSLKAGGSLNQVIKFLKTQGDVHSISNPKVLTLNNQPALITAGTEYFYKLSTTQTLAGNGTGSQNTNEDIQSVFAGVLLSITPEISSDNTITLSINPSLSETSSTMSSQTNTGRSMPPDLNRRQLSSVVTVKDGNRIILGGLINSKNTKIENKVPILGDIPIINYLFKYEEVVKTTQELVIIVEPHIIHKEKDTLSLSELGYKGLSNSKKDK